jgi:pimeloyl-ACP methyl ester carboxylesterase
MQKPVVFIPGFPATEIIYEPESWRLFPPALSDLRDPDRKRRLIELLSDPRAEGVVAGKPLLNVLGITKQAESLYNILSSIGYDTTDDSTEFIPVGWDWRRGLDDPETIDRVVDAVERLHVHNGRPVVVVVHSTGGLVLRAALASRPELAQKIEEILAFGVPWIGTLKALFAIHVGEGVEVPLLGSLIGRITDEESRFITSRCQAAYDLLPADPQKTQMPGVNLFMKDGRQVGPTVDTSWIAPGADTDFMRALAANGDTRFGTRDRNFNGPPLTNVVGWGRKTLTQCTVAADGSLTFDSSDDLAGDGTAPLVSASWIRGAHVRTFYLPIGVYPAHNMPHAHVRIWDSPPVMQFFSEVLLDEERMPFFAAAADGDDAVDREGETVRIRVSAAAADGKPLPKCRAVADLDGQRMMIPIPAGLTRTEFLVSRQGIRPNLGTTRFRFTIHLDWEMEPGEQIPDPAVVIITV